MVFLYRELMRIYREPTRIFYEIRAVTAEDGLKLYDNEWGEYGVRLKN